MSLERQITTSPGRHFRASPGRQIGTSWDGQIRYLGEILGSLEGDVLGTSWGPIFAGWVLPYIFLVISFVRYKEYMILEISFRKFSDFLLPFTCSSISGNL